MSAPELRLPAWFRVRIGIPADIDALCDIDRDAGELFVQAGLDLDLPDDHEFVTSERARWLRSLRAGMTLIAEEPGGSPMGFAAGGMRDGQPYLDQLSVRMAAMRRGIGTTLLSAFETQACASGAGAVWLTTYRHLSWNRPLYERCGFVAVPEAMAGPELLAELAHERRWLPLPHERTIMLKVIGKNRGPEPVTRYLDGRRTR